MLSTSIGTLRPVSARNPWVTALVAIAAVAAVAVAAAVAVGLGTVRTETVVEESFDSAQITDVPVVIATQQSGGFELFGLQLDAPDRWLSIAVKPPPDCLRPEGDVEVVIGGEGCETVESVAGPVRGGGITAEGERGVELWVEVDAECHRSAAVGDPWPAPTEACR